MSVLKGPHLTPSCPWLLLTEFPSKRSGGFRQSIERCLAARAKASYHCGSLRLVVQRLPPAQGKLGNGAHRWAAGSRTVRDCGRAGVVAPRNGRLHPCPRSCASAFRANGRASCLPHLLSKSPPVALRRSTATEVQTAVPGRHEDCHPSRSRRRGGARGGQEAREGAQSGGWSARWSATALPPFLKL